MIISVLAGLLAVWAGNEALAVDYTWTNTATGASGFWTNGNLWATPANYPGSNAADNAYLTNNTVAGGSYTNILNRRLNFVIGTLAISNSTSGQSWLVLTNAALTNTTFTIGTGGGLEIDSGGLFTNTTTFNWSGTNGVIQLNNNGTLITAAAVTIGSSASSITGLVTSTSSAGQGGTWKLNGQPLTIGNAGSFDVLTVNNVTFTNGGLVTVGSAGGGFNIMTVTNAQVWSTGLTIGNGGSNNAAYLQGGTWNMLGNTVTIGAGAATGNVLTVNGGVLTNVATITSTSAGGGTLVNNGNLWGGSALTITNAMIDTSGTNNITGTWTLQGGSPGILLLRSNSLLRAAATATITGAGQITNTGPANLEVDSGVLTISTTGSTSFNINSLVISNGGTIQFSGNGVNVGWQGSMTAAGNLTFGNASSALTGIYVSLEGDVDESLAQGLTINPAQNAPTAMTGGGIHFNGHNLTNEAGSTVNIVVSGGARSADFSSTGGPGTLVNYGTLTVPSGSLTFTITNVNVANSGTVNLNNTVTMQGGSISNSGTLNLNSTLTVQGGSIDNSGTVNLASTLTLQGGSTLLLRSNSLLRAATTATITGAGQITNTGPANLEVDGGNLTISTTGGISFNVKSLVISNGATLTFSTPGALIGSIIGWQGSMTAAGNITFGGGGNAGQPWTYLQLNGDVDESLGQGLTFSPGQNNGLGGILFNGHNLTNETGSTVSFVAGATRWAYLSSPTPATFVNKGNLTLTPGSISLSVTNVTFDNSGTLNVGGALNLKGNTDTILLLRSNSTVRGNYTTTSITGGKIMSDTNALTGAPVPVNFEVDTGQLTITPAAGNSFSLNVNSLVISNGATLSFAGNGINIGWRGSMTAAGTMLIGNGASALPGSYLSLEGDVDEHLGQGLTFAEAQNPTTFYTGGGIHFNGHSFTNEAGSVVSFQTGGGSRAADFASTGGPGILVNYGTLTIPGGQLGTFSISNVTVANSGTMNLATPTYSLASGGVVSNAVNGTLIVTGTARITGSSSAAFRNFGTVSVLTTSTGTVDTVDSSQWGVGGSLRAGTWQVGGSGILNLAPSDGVALSNISANATVIYAGGGTIQTKGGSYVSLTNSLTAIAGTLFLSNSTFNSGTALFAITNGTLNLNSGTLTTRSILLTNTGTIFGSGGVSGFSQLINNGTIRATNGVLTIAGLITGTGASFADTGGTLPLTNANTYTGMTVIDGGQLVVSDPNAVQNSLVSNTTAANGIVFSNVNNANFGGLAGTGDIGLTNGASGVALNVSNTANSTYSGALSGSGSLTKGGAGTLVLAGNNTYSGGTTISNGAVQAANNTALGSGLVTNLAGGAIQFNPTSATGVTGRLAELILLGFWRGEGQMSPLHRPGLSWL